MLRFDWRFTWFNKIRSISIQYVYFNSVPCDSWVEMKEVKVLDVSNNRLTDAYVFNQLCNYKGSAPNLRLFNMSTNELTSLKDLSLLTKEFQQLQEVDLSRNKLGSAAKSRNCVWQKSITRFIVHHNNFESSALHCLPTSVEFLDLSFCELDQLDMKYFSKTSNLKELHLSGNKIKYIPSKWESPSLWSLSLDGNSFGLISTESFQDMPLLSHLRAGNNPYHCTCELHDFVQDTLTKEKINLTDWPWNYKCYHPEPLLNTVISKYLPSKVACDIRLVIIICVATTTVVVLILVLICYIFDLPWYTKATFQIIQAKYRAHKERAAGEVGPFTYHAFISYSHSDADWVRDQLLPCLEDNKNPYRLCVHERDFMPGRWIIDNIIENIENSRKVNYESKKRFENFAFNLMYIFYLFALYCKMCASKHVIICLFTVFTQVIFVLSRHFVNSEWCNYELYFAQQRAMGKAFSDVILVVKEPIDPSSLPSKYCKLKKMLSTKTYLEWPQQPNQQAFFWAQLRSVLGRPMTVSRGRQSVRSRTSSVSISVIGALMDENSPEIPGEKVMETNYEVIENSWEVLNQRQIPMVAV